MKDGRDLRVKKNKEESKIEENEEEEEKKAKQKPDIKGFLERNYTNALNKTKPEKTEEVDYECTFKPKISEKSKEIAVVGHMDLFDRAEEIKKKKQEKIDAALKKKKEAELNGCTFRPQISKTHANYSPPVSMKKKNETHTGYAKNRYSKGIN